MIHGISRGKFIAMIIVERTGKENMTNRKIHVTMLADRWRIIVENMRMGQVGMAKAESGNNNVLFTIMAMNWG